MVSVTESGCGMHEKLRQHSFEQWYQGGASHAQQGHVLGLPLVKRVIDIVGCSISVGSEVGKGSTFMVRLRRAQHAAP